MNEKSSSSVKLTDGNIQKRIMLFALPVILGNLLQELYYVFDTLIVGKTLGDIKLAAVGSTSALSFLATGFIIGLTSGCAVITSQYFGADDKNGIKKSVAAHILISVITTLILTICFTFLVYPLLTMLNTTADTFEFAQVYLTIIYMGLPATMLYNLTASLLRSVGNSKIPLALLVFSSILNILLDLLFILVFKWDVAGAAIATVISQAVSAVLCVIYIKFKVPFIIPNKNSWKRNKENILSEIKLGFSMGFQNSVIAVGMMVLQFFVNGFGSFAMAAYTVGNRIQLLIQNPLASMSIVMATFTGQNEGAGKYDRIKSGTKIGVLLCVAFAVFIGIVTYIFAEPFAGLFVAENNRQVLDYAVDFIRWNCMFEWSLAFLFIFRGVIQGLRDGFVPILGSVLEVLMRVLSPVVLSTAIGFASISIAGPAAWSVSAVLMVIVYCYKFKKIKNKNSLKS